MAFNFLPPRSQGLRGLFLALAIAFSLALNGCRGNIFGQRWRCNVVRGLVFDGDTIRANCGGELKRVRFACIDAPELKQENGVASRDHLRSLLNRSENQVILQPIATDRFGRTVAEVYANGQLVQLEQAKAGMVWAYERYKRDCPHWAEVDKAFRAAKANGRGIFLRGNTIPPWQWRRIWDK